MTELSSNLDRVSRPRIFISAYGCEPQKGSEQGVGWHWVLEMAKVADVVVLTRSNNRCAIESALPREMLNQICFEFYDLSPFMLRFKRKERGLYLYYLLWQWGAYRRARSIVALSKYDYAMHLTFGSIWMPTFMHRLPVPFILGPVGGGEAVPFRLIKELPIKGRMAQYLRYALIATLPINPLLTGMLRRARIILARTEDTARVIPRRYSNKVRVVLETAMNDDVLSLPRKARSERTDGSLRVIFTGRLIPLKNVAVALQAVARSIDCGAKINFVILGDGPLRKSLELLSRKLCIESHVEFYGAVTQAEVILELHSSDVYIFPSLKEGGSWSLMEAMSLGLPTICVNGSGMAVITDDSSAIRIEALSQEQMISDFASALLELAQSPSKRQSLGENAYQRIKKHFRWRNKSEFMADLFNELKQSVE